MKKLRKSVLFFMICVVFTFTACKSPEGLDLKAGNFEMNGSNYDKY